MNTKPNSLWRDVELESFPGLSKDLNTEVTVVGTGITGITTAYFLVEKGYNVVLLEAGRIIEGTTGYTTAKITSQHGLIYDTLIQTMGEEKAKLYYQANEEALSCIDDIRKKEQIDCDFSYQDAYIYGNSKEANRKIEKEAEAYKRLGIDGGLAEVTELPYSVSSAVKINHQAQFHPVKYLASMIQRLQEKNTPIFENTRAAKLVEGDRPEVVTREGNTVTSDHVVMATHFPFADFKGLYFSRLHVERSYSIAVRSAENVPDGMYLSAEEPKKSLRHFVTEDGEKLLLVGGEGHPSGQKENTEESYENLAVYAKEQFGSEDVSYHWSSQDLITLDMVPYIGPVTKNNSNIHIAAGFAKWGMTNGTIAAKVISDLIAGKDNPYIELFSPSRDLGKQHVKSFLKENMDVGKEFVKGKLDRKNIKPEDLAKDEGSVVRINGKRAGAYKDEHGSISIVDTTCTHMGCELNWNNGDRSWDCPCHGSRFTVEGEVIEGPATKPLSKLSDK
ncbi:FAD-dependent oxidoreductase [Halobacillus campisalis]|uniref:FAD-dependent oxidoreductase n=1 Tax=Halobacillus campisalis TaxID=435909 RepID=A0ABW2K0L1_9BACI|nr:FAD-dependent oxidoreductase [Halobacillus campisalis]